MGHHHGHHHHGHRHDHGTTQKNLLLAFVLNAGFSLLEFVGGLWTGSVAILSDAVHDLGDALALGTAFYMEKMAARKADSRFSYGYRRLSLLSALITGAFLLCGSVWVMTEAIPRLWAPETPKLGGMAGFALLGIAVNGYAAWKVHRGRTLNERMVSWHLLEDVLGWVAVLVGAGVMALFDLPIIDPILSILFTGFILWNVFRSLRSTLNVFLQGVPEDVDVELLRQDLCKIDGLLGLHDIHMWSLDGERHVLTIHAVVRSDTNLTQAEAIKSQIRARVEAMGNIHATIEIESEDEVHGCPSLDCAR